MAETNPKENIVESIFKKVAATTEKRDKIASFFEKHKGVIPGIKAEENAKSLREKDIAKFYPFGVDIGSNFIKFAQFAKDKSGNIQLFDLGMFEVPSVSRETSETERNEFLLKLFKSAFKDKKPKDIYVNLPAGAVEIKILKLPTMPLKEINDAVLWELKQAYGEKIDEFSLDTLLLSDAHESNRDELEVLLVIATKKVISNHISVFRKSGFNVLAVEVDPFALNEALILSGQVDNEPIGILDIGSDLVNFSISLNKKIYFSRNLSVTGDSISKSIASYCNVDPNTAESLKINFGIEGSSPEGLTVRNAIIPLLENLANDVEHSFKYFSYQLMKSRVTNLSKLILAGGTSHLKGLPEYIKSRLDVPVEMANPVKGLNINNELQKKFNIEQLAANFAVSIGLAYRKIQEEE